MEFLPDGGHDGCEAEEAASKRPQTTWRHFKIRKAVSCEERDCQDITPHQWGTFQLANDAGLEFLASRGLGSKGVVTMAKEPEAEEESSDDNDALLLMYISRLAKRVREARIRAKLKQSELGALIGSNQSYIFLVEKAHANLTFRNFVRLAHALKVNPEDLLMPDQILSVIDKEKVQELSVLVQNSISEMKSTTDNAEKVSAILQHIYNLLVQHSESLKAPSSSES